MTVRDEADDDPVGFPRRAASAAAPQPAPGGEEDGASAGPLLSQARLVSRVRSGGRVTAVRLRGELGGYTVAVEVGWSPGVRYTVATYARAVKFYRSASHAIGMVRSSYRYRGEIVVEALPSDDGVGAAAGDR